MCKPTRLPLNSSITMNLSKENPYKVAEKRLENDETQEQPNHFQRSSNISLENTFRIYNIKRNSGTKKNRLGSCFSKKFSCQNCSYQTNYKFNIERHNRTHTMSRGIANCYVCNKPYSSKYNMDRHISTIHSR
ncbi:hypothetical protein CLU79DRAFT_728492 [Phycomyces nitens]|nr:hypothetical protein CLU79DRAFT_728492 [Phycomyces nitens]